MTGSKIKVLVSDDHRLVRRSICSFIEKQQDMQIVGEASDGEMTIQMVKKFNPDVVLMDISMPKCNGIQATKQIMKENPNTKVIALSVHSAEQYVYAMLGAGARDYIVKDHSLFMTLAKVIRAVFKNKKSQKIPN